MNEVADNWTTVAAGLTRRAAGLTEDEWNRPTPCEGWVARDIVAHLAEWVPAFLAGGADVPFVAPASDVDSFSRDPFGTWTALAQSIASLLADPVIAASTFDHPQAGRHRLDHAIDAFITGDVLIHTWDLARATGRDETLDADAVARMLPAMRGIGDQLVASGHYRPGIALPDGADAQSQLLAATGRDPR